MDEVVSSESYSRLLLPQTAVVDKRWRGDFLLYLLVNLLFLQEKKYGHFIEMIQSNLF